MQLSRNRALVLAGIGVLAAVLVIVLILAAAPPERRYDEPRTGDPGAAAGRPVHPVGRAVRLRTYLTTIEVRPLSYVRLPATASDGPGIGVDVSLKNVGRATYRDQPTQAASVTFRRGGEAERLYTSVERCQGPPRDTVKIRPGVTKRYCIPFETGGARLALFIYAPEAGLPGSRGAPEAAAWSF